MGSTYSAGTSRYDVSTTQSVSTGGAISTQSVFSTKHLSTNTDVSDTVGLLTTNVADVGQTTMMYQRTYTHRCSHKNRNYK